MRRKLLATVGLVSPILLGLCAFAILFMGAVGWLFFGADDSEIVKVATVGPFFTFKIFDDEAANVTDNAELAVGSASTEADQIDVSANAEQDDVSTNLEADVPAITAAEIQEQLGFALPENSVNSITGQGLANRLVIPKLKLDAPIMLAPIKDQTWDVSQLGQAVGHLEGTARPGSASNVVLAGHVTLDTGEYGPFAGLGKLSAGDSIYVYEGGQQYEYVIDGRETVDITAVEVTYPTETGQLTLITCNNWSAEEGRYVERLIMKGHLLN